MTDSRIEGWGRTSVLGQELSPDNLEQSPPVLFRGLGRSYGDSSLPPSANPVVVNTTRANRMLAFDTATGTLRAEAGLSLLDLHRTLLPRGWFVPVTPGTQFVTLGGAVAADVHGKNHHVDGCFGSHVRRLKMRVADGRVVECGPDLERELFLATVGGMGLTGQILEVEFPMVRIPTPWIWQESERVGDIDEYIEKLVTERQKAMVPAGTQPFYKAHDNGIRLELAMVWTEATDEFVKSYVNGIPTKSGGTHENGLKSGVVKAVRNYIETHNLTPKGVTLTAEDILWRRTKRGLKLGKEQAAELEDFLRGMGSKAGSVAA